jgi:hypothetical protein
MIVKVDKTAPEDDGVGILFNGENINAGGAEPRPVYASVFGGASLDGEAASSISGCKRLEYQLVEPGGEPAEEGWALYSDAESFTNALSARDNTSFRIYVRVTDNAGNRPSPFHKGYILDSVAPTVELSGNPSYWTAEDVTLHVAAEDYVSQGEAGSGFGSGLHETAYRYSFNGAVINGGTNDGWTSQPAWTFAENGEVKLKSATTRATYSTKSRNQQDRQTPAG